MGCLADTFLSVGCNSTLKKKVPNIIKIEIPYNVEAFEKMHLNTIHEDFENGYSVSHYDFELYCAIRIRLFGLESLPENYKKFCLENNKLKDRIRFHKTRLEKQIIGKLTKTDELFFNSYRRQKVNERKEVIKYEISRTGINANKITLQNSDYLKMLLSIVREFDDELTLIRWFIPIKLSFEKIVHFYIKHVEETKFAPGAFANRTFFTYEFDQIFTLLKVIVRVESENIKEHFANIAVAEALNEEKDKKDYINNRISYNNDTFALSINKAGYISKFHQIR